MNYRTPVKKARGLGSASHGAGHWWSMRVAAVGLVPLMLWFVVGVATYSGGGYQEAVSWIGAPVNAVLLILMIALAFYHGAQGLQEILMDYVGNENLRMMLILLEKFAAVVLAVAAIFAVLSIALGG